MFDIAPFRIKTLHGRDDLHQVPRDAAKRGNKLLVGSASIGFLEDGEEIVASGDDIHTVVHDSLPVFVIEAIADHEVIGAPVAIGVSQMLNLAEIEVLVGHSDEITGDHVGFVNRDGEWVNSKLLNDGEGSCERIVHPVSHAFIRNKVGGRSVEAFDGGFVHSSEELSFEPIYIPLITLQKVEECVDDWHMNIHDVERWHVNFAVLQIVDEFVEDRQMNIQVESWHMHLWHLPTVWLVMIPWWRSRKCEEAHFAVKKF